jgi:hypothetical protein
MDDMDTSICADNDAVTPIASTDSDSDIAEDLRFEKLPEPPADELPEVPAYLPVSGGVSEVLASLATSVLPLQQSIISFAQSMIVERVRWPTPSWLPQNLQSHILRQRGLHPWPAQAHTTWGPCHLSLFGDATESHFTKCFN